MKGYIVHLPAGWLGIEAPVAQIVTEKTDMSEKVRRSFTVERRDSTMVIIFANAGRDATDSVPELIRGSFNAVWK